MAARRVGRLRARPGPAGAQISQPEVLRRVAVAFRQVTIDWPEGRRWAEARAGKADEIGYPDALLALERGLQDRSVLVSVADDDGPDAAWVRFYMTPDAGLLELYYEPAGAVAECRALAVKLAGVLGYEFATD